MTYCYKLQLIEVMYVTRRRNDSYRTFGCYYSWIFKMCFEIKKHSFLYREEHDIKISKKSFSVPLRFTVLLLCHWVKILTGFSSSIFNCVDRSEHCGWTGILTSWLPVLPIKFCSVSQPKLIRENSFFIVLRQVTDGRPLIRFLFSGDHFKALSLSRVSIIWPMQYVSCET